VGEVAVVVRRIWLRGWRMWVEVGRRMHDVEGGLRDYAMLSLSVL